MSRDVASQRRRIDGLQILRGLFTVMIFLSHLPFPCHTYFYKPSECAVTFFFMLSGFILCRAYEGRVSRGEVTIPRFMTSRLIRIYPLHIIGFVGALILTLAIGFGTPLSPLSVSANLLLIQSWFPTQDIYYSCNGVSWFLSSLLFCYLMFIPLIRLMLNHISLLLIASACLIGVYLIVAHVLPEQDAEFALYVFPPTRLIDFLAGIVLYRAMSAVAKGHVPYFQLLNNFFKIIAIASVAATLLTASQLYNNYTIAAYWWVPLALLIFTFSYEGIVGKHGEKPVCQDGSKQQWFKHIIGKVRMALVWFGDISFSFFLLHSLVIVFVAKVFDKLSVHIPTAVQIAVIFVIAMAVAYISQQYIVTPIEALLKKRLTSTKTSVSQKNKKKG